MAAVLAPIPTLTPGTDPRRRPARAPLRVIPGGRDAARRRRLHPAVYRRRRLVAALLGLVVVATLALAVVGAAALVGSSGAPDGTPAATEPASGPSAAAPEVTAGYVVQPGDTVWEIARRLQPEGDVRPLVDRLAERTGGGALVAGQRLDLDGLVD